MIEPSDAERATLPFTTQHYIQELEAENERLRKDLDDFENSEHAFEELRGELAAAEAENERLRGKFHYIKGIALNANDMESDDAWRFSAIWRVCNEIIPTRKED